MPAENPLIRWPNLIGNLNFESNSVAAVFAGLGLSFDYPENWELDRGDALEGRQSVTVFSPGGGFFTVVVSEVDADPADLSESALNALREEYSDVEFDDAHQMVAGHQLAGHDVRFVYLDLTSTATVRTIQTSSATLLLFCQAEDDEYEEIRPVFDAMTQSLLSRLA